MQGCTVGDIPKKNITSYLPKPSAPRILEKCLIGILITIRILEEIQVDFGILYEFRCRLLLRQNSNQRSW